MRSRRSSGRPRARRRRIAMLAIGCALAIGAGSAPAGAYRLGGKAWARDVITYRVTVARHRAPMAEAARQWNTSGVRLRFREVRSGRADVVVRHLRVTKSAPCLGTVGRATLGFTRGFQSYLELHPRCSQLRLIGVAVHELGHVMGLAHSNRRCALMSPSGGSACSDTRGVLPWEVVCRGLRPDDVSGAIRRYGGRPRPLPTERICLAQPTPGPATDLKVELNPAGSLAATRLTWRNPVSSALRRIAINRNTGPCATYPAIPDGTSFVTRLGEPQIAGDPVGVLAPAGAVQSTVDFDPEAGRVCYAVWTVGPDNRYVKAATVVVDHPGPAPLTAARIGLTAAAAPGPGVAARLTWQNTADPGLTHVHVLRSDAPCPADPTDYFGFRAGSVAFTPGPASFDDAAPLTGPTCYRLSFARQGSFEEMATAPIQLG